jgi:hypothetical protein
MLYYRDVLHLSVKDASPFGRRKGIVESRLVFSEVKQPVRISSFWTFDGNASNFLSSFLTAARVSSEFHLHIYLFIGRLGAA